MGQLLEDLHQLQAVELKLAAIRRARVAKERRVDTCRRRAQHTDEQLKRQKHAIQGRQSRLDSLGLEVASREESITRHRQALAKAKTNKEYASILTAMNTEKADNTKFENTMLEIMEEIQNAKDERRRIEAEREKLLANVQAAEVQLEAYDAEFSAERAQLEEQRDEYASRVPPSALATFNRAAQRHDGEAMAAVRKTRPKREEYVCSGCNMSLTLEVINALQTRDEIQLCDACGRILHLEPAETSRR